jgi:hypothetical protein
MHFKSRWRRRRNLGLLDIAELLGHLFRQSVAEQNSEKTAESRRDP